MRLSLSAEQESLGEEVGDRLSTLGLPSAIRQWANGDHSAGLAVWDCLVEMGLTGLCIPESVGGAGATATDTIVVAEQLGRHAVPGPWIESFVLVPTLFRSSQTLPSFLPEWDSLLDGTARVSATVDEVIPLALDTDAATHVIQVSENRVRGASVETVRASVDPSRRLSALVVTDEETSVPEGDATMAVELATLAHSASLFGAAERMLEQSVQYLLSRRQFGRVIGEYQALKHRAADVRVALDFARPLIHGAAVALEAGWVDAPRAVSAAKVSSARAADKAALAALQLHGAIGYTSEYDLSLLLLRVRATVAAWGTEQFHRNRILDSLVAEEGRAWTRD